MVWKHADPGEKTQIVKAIGRNYPAFKRDPERCDIVILPLPFYPDARLVKLTARDIPGSALWYILLPEEAIALSESLAAINHANSAGPLVLKDTTVHAYIKFRYFFTGGAVLFEARVKRSAVGYSGKIWIFEKQQFFEIDINISPRGLVTELERVSLPDIPDFVGGEFDL